MMARRWQRGSGDRGFTLVELVAMLALIAALSIAAAPALTVVQRSRDRAAVTETARLVALAQRRAMTTGEPTGVQFDSTTHAVTLLRLQPGAIQPRALDGPTGAARRELMLDVAFPGSRIESFSTGADAGMTNELWFNDVGVAHARDQGALVTISRDARLELSGGVIRVRAVTGAVEW